MPFEIIRHIEELLHAHCCVVVEGLGAFVLQRESALIVSSRDVGESQASHSVVGQATLIAPQARVSFHAGLRHDDGLLISSLARSQKMSYVAARQYLMQAVQVVHKELQSGAVVPMGRLGSLGVEDDRIVFTPRSNAWLADNLGAVNVPLPRVREAETANKDYIVVRLPRTRVRYATACVIGAILLSIAPRGQVVEVQQYADLSPVNYAAIIAEREAARQAELELLRLQEEAVRPKNCHIVVASLDKAAAERYCERLHSKGYANAKIKPYKRTSRVIIDSFETRREAITAMNELRQNTPYKRAWVWIAK